MKKIFCLCLGICFLSISQAQVSESILNKRLKGLDAELEQALQDWNVAGFAVAIVNQDKILYSKGFGYRDYQKKIPATENTQFAIGSCSKSFTAALLGKLEEQEKLSLDDSPRDHIPYLKFYNDELNAGVTIRDMMCHRTGMPRHDLSWYIFVTQDRDSLLQRLAYQEPLTGLRERWYYNNFMYLAQGVIAEKITGKSWEDNIREHFLQPLGMNNSTMTIQGIKDSPEASIGYTLSDEGEIEAMEYYDIAAMSPAGSINSSVKEMASWVKTWINGGKHGDKQLIPQKYVRQAISSQMVVSGYLPETESPDMYFGNYGLGWFLSSYKGHYRVEHGGNIDGFSASTSFFPADSLGVVVLVNQNGSLLTSVVRNLIADRILGLEKTEWSKKLREEFEKAQRARAEAEKAGSSKQENTRPSHLLPEFTGVYEHPGYGSFELVVERDSLFAIFPQEKAWLKHYHFDVFEPYEMEDGVVDTSAATGLFMNFYTNSGGDIAGLRVKFEPVLDPLDFTRTPTALEIEPEALQKYVGEYALSGVRAEVFLKGEKTLYLRVPGQPEYELFPTEEHTFSIRNLDGYKVQFVPGEGEEITEVKFIQPNGTFTAKRK